MRKPIVAGNWKCHKTTKEAAELTREILAQLGTIRSVEVVLCPPFTALKVVAEVLGDDRAGTVRAGEGVPQRAGAAAGLGAQDLYWEPQGAFTGEISAPMLTDVGCRYCIIGHSERRHTFGETDEQVARKLRAALEGGLTPIVCVGETLPEREANRTVAVVERQLEAALKGLAAEQVTKLVIAYEPVWAIGTGRNAAPAQAQEVHAFIRQWLKTQWSAQVADAVRIQYGGSVTAANAAELLGQPDVDGALVGGASLKADAFAAIVRAAAESKKLAVK